MPVDLSCACSLPEVEGQHVNSVRVMHRLCTGPAWHPQPWEERCEGGENRDVAAGGVQSAPRQSRGLSVGQPGTQLLRPSPRLCCLQGSAWASPCSRPWTIRTPPRRRNRGSERSNPLPRVPQGVSKCLIPGSCPIQSPVLGHS